ncbi:MAG: hypothetical protein HS130_07420 [Deltaproteobacteria bacterium]|nr:hypothetical protein [Deltaproteobacteria bacterium]
MEVLNDMEQPQKTIIDHLTVFVHRKWLFIAPLVLGAVAGLVVSFELPEKYSSTTLIVVEEQQIPEEYVTPTDRTPFSQRLNLISQQILSRTRLDQIIREFRLYDDHKPSIFSRALAFVTGEDIEDRTPDDIISRMREDIQFMVIGETNTKKPQTGGNAFTITYIGTEPQTTMQVTNTLASLFIEENLKVREQYAEGTTEFISSELEKSQEELASIEQKIKDFKQAHMGTLPEQLEANLRTLDRLQLDLQNVTVNLKHSEDRKQVLDDQLRYTPTPNAVSPAVRSTLEVELENARAELSMLLSNFKETYPDVLMLKRRIQEIETRLAAEPAPAPEPVDKKAISRS